MAEALVVLGATASALQLSQAIYKAAKQLFSFFCAIKHSSKEIEDLRNALKNMEDVADYVQSFVTTLQSQNREHVEQETLLGLVANLTRCRQELTLLQDIVDETTRRSNEGGKSKLAARISWVFETDKIQGSMRRLNGHSMSLMTALIAANGHIGLSIRGDLQVITANVASQTEKLDENHESTLRNIDTLGTQMQEFSTRQSHALENVKSQNDAQKNILQRHTAELTEQAQRELENFTNLRNLMERNREENRTVFSDIQSHQADDRETLEILARESIRHLRSATNSRKSILKKLGNLEEQFAEFSVDRNSIRAETHMTDVDDHAFALYLQNQMQGLLPKLVEECVSRANQELRGYVRSSMEDAPKAVDLAASKALFQFVLTDESSERGGRDVNNRSSASVTNFNKVQSNTENFDYNGITIQESTEPFRISTGKRWEFKWKIGVLILSIRKTAIRIGPARTRIFEVRLCFIPALWISSSGLVMSYRQEVDPRGYPSLYPNLSAFAVVPHKAEQFYLVQTGDVEKLREMFLNGLAGPRDRKPDGLSLLYVAIKFAQWETCAFLISQGADIHADNGHGNAMTIFYQFALEDIWSLQRPSTYALNVNVGSRCEVHRLLQEARIDDTEYKDMNINRSWALRWFNIYFFQLLKFYSYTGIFRLENIQFFTHTKIGEPLVQTYRSLGMDFESTDCDGWTCLTVLALHAAHSHWRGYYFALYSLLAGGCNANSRNSAGENAYHAILYGCIRPSSKGLWYSSFDAVLKDVCDVLRLLWIHGCDLSARDSQGRTPTQLATFLTELMSLDISSIWKEALRRIGVDVNALIRNENSIVHIGTTSALQAEDSKPPLYGLRYRGRQSNQTGPNETRLFDEERNCKCISCAQQDTEQVMVFEVHPWMYFRIQNLNKLGWS